MRGLCFHPRLKTWFDLSRVLYPGKKIRAVLQSTETPSQFIHSWSECRGGSYSSLRLCERLENCSVLGKLNFDFPSCASLKWIVVVGKEHDFSGRPSGKFSGATEFWKGSPVSPVFQVRLLQTVFHFFKAIFDTSFRLLRSFFGEWKWFVQMVNGMLGWNLPEVLTFVTISQNREPTILPT